MGNKRGKAALRSAISRGGVNERVIADALTDADYSSKAGISEFEASAQTARICSFPPCQAKKTRARRGSRLQESQLSRDIALRRAGHASTLTAWWE
jgi:hypothetical protein